MLNNTNFRKLKKLLTHPVVLNPEENIFFTDGPQVYSASEGTRRSMWPTSTWWVPDRLWSDSLEKKTM